MCKDIPGKYTIYTDRLSVDQEVYYTDRRSMDTPRKYTIQTDAAWTCPGSILYGQTQCGHAPGDMPRKYTIRTDTGAYLKLSKIVVLLEIEFHLIELMAEALFL